MTASAAWIDRLLDLGLPADAEAWRISRRIATSSYISGRGYGWSDGDGYGDGEAGYGDANGCGGSDYYYNGSGCGYSDRYGGGGSRSELGRSLALAIFDIR